MLTGPDKQEVTKPSDAVKLDGEKQNYEDSKTAASVKFLGIQ